MKKNQFALIFLTVITMLAVWYLKSPTKNNDNHDDTPVINVNNVTGRTDELASMRQVVRDERNLKLASLNDIIADESATLVSKTAAIAEKEQISTLNEQEVLLESKVMNLGYRDAFVHYTASGVEVIVVANASSATAALDVIDIIYQTFDKTANVVVNFVTAEELKGI